MLVGVSFGVWFPGEGREVGLALIPGDEDLPGCGIPGRVHTLVQWQTDCIVGFHNVIKHTLRQSVTAHLLDDIAL